MLETADRIESSIQETSSDVTAGPSVGIDSPPDERAGFGWLGRALIGCLVAEAVVAAIALAVLAGVQSSSEPDPIPGQRQVAVAGSDGADDTEAFLSAWGRSLRRDHTATGTLTRTLLDRDTLFTSAWPTSSGKAPTSTVLPYRHSRLNRRALTQIGDVATVVDPLEGRRTCFRQTAGFACTADEVSSDDALTAVSQAVSGSTATHRIVAIDSTDVLVEFPRLPADIRCWEARSVTDGIDQRWGRRAQFCFHDPSGAAVFRRVLATTRVEVLVVESVSEPVSPADLDPA